MIRTANPLTPQDATTLTHPDLDEFCHRHGLSPDVVLQAEYDVIDCPFLRFTVYELDELDRKFAKQDETGRWHPATYVIQCPLIGELPWWWQVTSQP